MSRIIKDEPRELSNEDWDELMKLRQEMSESPWALGPDAMELFTNLLVRSLDGKGDPSF